MVHIFNSNNATKNDGFWTKDKKFLCIANIPPRLYNACIQISKDPLFWKDIKNLNKMKKFLTSDSLAYNLNRDVNFYDKEENIIHILQDAGLMPTLQQILDKDI